MLGGLQPTARRTYDDVGVTICRLRRPAAVVVAGVSGRQLLEPLLECCWSRSDDCRRCGQRYYQQQRQLSRSHDEQRQRQCQAQPQPVSGYPESKRP